MFDELNHNHRDGENGVYVVTLAALLLVMLLLIGYAVDSGNLYNGRAAAQTAADAAALSASAYLATHEGDFDVVDGELDSKVRDLAEAMVAETLKLRGYDLALIRRNEATVVRQLNAAEPARSKLSVSVRVRLTVPLLVLRFAMGIGDSRDVETVAESDVRPAIISLILDNSGSMGCPNVDPEAGLFPDCSCFPACADKKIDFLKTALTTEFIPALDGVRDILAVTTFNTVASSLVAANPNGGFDKAAVTALINGITEQGTTNFTDALDTGYEAIIAAKQQQPEFEKIFVLFSDGSPTGARLSFSNPDPSLPMSSTSRGDYDYAVWSVDWQIPPDPTKFDGVSRLSPAPVNLANCTDNGCVNSPACSTVSFAGGGTDDAATELGGCLQDLRFRDRNGAVWPALLNNDDNIPTAGAINVDYYRERFMDAAVAIADAMRADGGLILTVGLGQAPVGSLPYESPRSEFTRKDNYMARLALSPSGGEDFPGYHTFEQLLGKLETHRPGEYFPTPNAAELPEIFRAIIARIKLQLIR